MKVLQLCKKFPYPPIDGETIAITNLSKALNHWGCDVTLLALNTTKHYFDLDLLPGHYNHYKEIFTVDIDNRLNLFHAIQYHRQGASYQLGRFKSVLFENKLKEILQKSSFDVVIVESVHMGHYLQTIRKYSRAQIVLKCHNVEHELWSRIAENTSFSLKRWYLRNEARLMAQFEMQALKHVDRVIFLSKRDRDVFVAAGFDNDYTINPSSLDLSYYNTPKTSKNFTIGFIGSLDWIPNVEGLKWFLDNVWPQVYKALPYAEFHVAGRNPGNDFYSRPARNIFIHGEVRSAKDFMSDHQILVVPLLSGSGIRIKILEGLALERTVITTPLGVEGIDAMHGEHLLIAKNSQEFIKNIQYCAMDDELMTKLGTNGRLFIQSRYDVLKQTRKLLKYIHPTYPKISRPGVSKQNQSLS
ncbi:MAG: glycosyltransferase family 4 protein [Bacteroidia bacterium]|nr:glycosyltransferase family 4 protein [Bacteroidia bacterium]